MGMYIEDYQLLIMAETETIYFDLSKYFGNSFKYKIHSIVKHN